LIPRIVYVNGRFVPYAAARVHVEDRGYLFADGVYEVCAIRKGCLLDMEPHLTRLDRSLSELKIAAPMSRAALLCVMAETLRRSAVRNGILYMQVTRGVAPRDHVFPDPPVAASLVMLARPVDMHALEVRAINGMRVVTMPDNRWARRDIKTIGLLGNVLGKQAAKEQGASEVWFVDQAGFVTEGGSTNAWIVDAQGRLRTRPLSNDILPGVTRHVLASLLPGLQLRLHEEPFTAAEAKAAREAFSTSAGALIMPIVAIDGVTIADGTPGPVARQIRQSYLKNAVISAL
jgi:D-alanine transaminase